MKNAISNIATRVSLKAQSLGASAKKCLDNEDGDFYISEGVKVIIAVMLIHFSVPEDDVYNDKPTEYAGQYVFIEYRNKEKTSQIVSVAPNEYADVNNPHRLRTACEGRIGNVYYLCEGYYDLSTHTYKRYEKESELPKYEMRHFMSNKEILEIARQDEVLSG